MLRFERGQLNWKFAVLATIVVICLLAAGIVFGGTGIAGVMGFVLTFLAWSGEEDRRWSGLLSFGSAGTVVGLLAFGAAGDIVSSSLLLGGVSYLAALAISGSGRSGTRWGLLGLWALAALLVAESDAVLMAGVGFATGFGLSSALLMSGRRARDSGIGRVGTEVDAPSLRGAISGDSGRFALIKGLAIGLSVPLGFAIFPDTPYWVALTVIIVAQAGRDDTIQLAVQRATGTFLGVIVGLGVVWLLPGDGVWLPVAVVLIILAQMLFLNVNYVLFALFLTALILVGSALADADVADVGWQRLLATLLGALVAIGVVLSLIHI